MSELYPLLMKPYFESRPWGSRDLGPIYDRQVGEDEPPIGEVWLTWDHCQIANGPFAGRELGELCRLFGRDLVGAHARETDRFPLLIKFLFPRDKLSVQVHPDDATAAQQGEPCGKTECWYVVRAERGAQVGLGLKTGVTRADFERSIHENRAEAALEWVDLASGDMMYVDAGTVHTLGPGSVILEAQQNSDTTYRLYDYGRPRELHLKQGLAALKERTAAGKISPTPLGAGHDRLIENECFVVERLALDHEHAFTGLSGASPICLVATRGAATLELAGHVPCRVERGEALVVPACIRDFRVRAQPGTELVVCTVP